MDQQFDNSSFSLYIISYFKDREYIISNSMSQGSEEGGGKRTAPVGGTGTKPTAANNLDTEAGGGTKDVMDKTGEAFQFVCRDISVFLTCSLQ